MAALCLLVWASALIACAADCGTVQKQSGCCHKKASSHARERAFCLHSQPVAQTQPAGEILKPAFDFMQFFPVEFPVTMPGLETPAISLRHAARADFVFAPEVCLGAAFRTLAPPVLP